MVANLFTDINYAEIVGRLQKLHADSPRQWGTMSAAQMLRHCRAQIEFILQPNPKAKVYKTLLRFAPARWVALYLLPWGKNLKTAPEMDVNKQLTDTGSFAHEQHTLLQRLQELYATDKVQAIHPLLGNMGKQQWGRVVWKHLDHHLRQFGC
jgi:acyl transferase domain-containing protein